MNNIPIINPNYKNSILNPSISSSPLPLSISNAFSSPVFVHDIYVSDDDKKQPVFASPLGNNKKVTGHEAKIEEKKKIYKEAFKLLNVVNKLFFFDPIMKSLSKCHRVSKGHYVVILKNGISKFYSGLLKCNSVFSCPVCSIGLAFKRKEQVSSAISEAIKQNLKVSMITLTFSHGLHHKLDYLLKTLGLTLEDFFSQRGVKQIFKDIGYVGRITRLEDTWGHVSGWHPHIHILLFTEKEVNEKILENLLEEYWISALKKNGLSGASGIALNVINGLKAEHYLTKLSLEMTLSQYKKSSENISGFGLLYKYMETRDPLYLDLFKERAYALKGKNFIRFSRGLAARFGLNIQNDKDTAEEIEQESELVLMLLFKDFKNKIMKNNLAGDLLDMVDDKRLLKAFLDDLHVSYVDDPEQMKILYLVDKQTYYERRKTKVYEVD